MIVPDQIIHAIVGAVIYAASGYLKSQEPWNTQKFLSTIVVGLVVGVMMYATGMSYDAVFAILLSVGVVAIIESLVKAAYRRVFGVRVHVLRKLAK